MKLQARGADGSSDYVEELIFRRDETALCSGGRDGRGRGWNKTTSAPAQRNNCASEIRLRIPVKE